MTAIGVIGCGMVSHAYLGTIARAPELRLAALAGRSMASAEAQAKRYGGCAMTVDALLADPEISVVVNLAPPAVHHALGRRVLAAGKHLYSEKPFAIRLEDAHDLLALADAQGLRIGCAPDTFLGKGHQAARRLLDSGAIGTVTAGAIAFGTRGMESWHPDPASFYAPGGGPLLDVGPYYITHLVNLLGPVVEVGAIGTRPHATRTASTPGREGEVFPVAVPTTVNGALLFASGANIALAMSWDVVAHRRPAIELYGTSGTLQAPDPNQFGGATTIADADGHWTTIGDAAPARTLDAGTLARALQAIGQGLDPLTGAVITAETTRRFGDLRGLGLRDLVAAIGEDREPRASGRLASHVLEVLLALQSSAEGAGRIVIRSTVDRPSMLIGDLP
uniref:Gfo/Idh/MocA family protein n=1 Tax=uncultured Sphingomonas sp. TaxID=158754 RepID=UPI0035CA42BC